MRKLIYGLFGITLLVMVTVVFSQSSSTNKMPDSESIKVVPYWSSEILNSFPYAALRDLQAWDENHIDIEPPFVNRIIWQSLDGEVDFPYLVVQGLSDSRSCAAYYDEGLASNITMANLAEAVATCFDIIMGGRADGMSNSSERDLDVPLISAYAQTILDSCDSLEAFGWKSAEGESLCVIPSGFSVSP